MRGAGDQHSAEKSPWGNSWWPWKTGQVIFTSLYRGLLFYTCVWALLTPPTFNGIIWDFLSPITKWLWPVPGNTHEGCSPKFWLRIHSDNLEITRSMYMQHSERVCTSSFRQIQGSDCWGHWTCWRVSLATKKSDTDHIHQPTSTMGGSTCGRKHGFWRTPWNTRCSSGLCRTSQFWMDWVLVQIHQRWRWEQLLDSSLCIQLTCYYGISHIKLDRLHHILILSRAGLEYLTLVPIQEPSWRKMVNWGQMRGLE